MSKLFLVLLSISLLSTAAYSEIYNTDSHYYNNGEYYTDNEEYYCAPKTNNFWSKIKESFVGLPTGYTPSIAPSPYINNFGPSYMQGFYGSNGWNNHNVYNPVYSGAGIRILN